MRTLTNIIDFISLVLQLIGAIVMYYNSPENRPTGTMIGGNYDPVTPRRKNKFLRRGFLLLAIGIVFSIVSLLLKDFGNLS